MLLRRIAIVTGIAVAFVAASAGVASAHVTVNAPGAERGGSDQIITFRVPTESDTASTTALKVQLPIDTPIASVLVQPVPGWSFTETTTKLAKPIVTDDGDITDAVSEIDWKADTPADGIAPNSFQQFVIIAGQLPDVPSLTFKAIQTYSDGSEVDWIEVPAAGSNAEPDHPAPVLTLAASTGADATGTSSTSSSSSNTAAIVLAIVALVLAATALGLVIITRARQRAGAATTGSDDASADLASADVP